MAILSTQGLHTSIAGKTVCRDLQWEIRPGECWAMLGGNGVGKTTLLHTLAGLRPCSRGEVLLNGTPLHTLPRRRSAQQIGMLFQESSDAFPATVLETALAGRHPYLKLLQWESARDRQLARDALQQLELAQMQERLVTTLSGGERRRLAIATLLTQNPPIALLDEPVNHLDLRHQIQALNLIQQRCQQEGKSALITLHDINLAARYCSHAMLMFGNGEILWGESAELLQTPHLERLYHHPLRRICNQEQECAFLPG